MSTPRNLREWEGCDLAERDADLRDEFRAQASDDEAAEQAAADGRWRR